MIKPEYIVLHHTAYRKDVPVSEIKNWHLARNFSDVGYHLYIRKNGNIQGGRSIHKNGAHCIERGMNRKSIGVCCSGDFDKECISEPQWITLKKLIQGLCLIYDIPVRNVIGHGEAGSPKTCPGKNFPLTRLRYTLSELFYSKENGHE